MSASVWIVCQSDDYLEAAFTTKAAAEAWKAKRDAEYFARHGADSSWWIEEVALDPASDADLSPSYAP